MTHSLLVLRQDVAILLTWIGRFNPHQHQFRHSCFHELCQLMHGGKIAVLHVWIDRTDSNGFVFIDALHIMQVCADECNRRKRITATRLNADIDCLTKLIPQHRDLRLRCRNRDLCTGNRMTYLSADTLRHRVPRPVTLLKEGNELL